MSENDHSPGIVVANTSAVFEHDGKRVRIIKGKTTVEVGHPLLKARQHLFVPLVVDYPRQARAKANA